MDRPFHVLLVHTEDTFTETLTSMVKRNASNVSVEAVSSVETAFDRFDSEPISCIVSGMDVLEGNGPTFLETVRARDPSLPIIFVTDGGANRLEEVGLAGGVTEYVSKRGSETYRTITNRIVELKRWRRKRQSLANSGIQPLELLEHVSDAVIALDEEWNFVFVNEAAEAVFDASTENLLGECLWELFPEAIDTPFYEAYHEAVERGESRRIEEYFEPWGRWYREHLHPTARGLIVIFEDVTEQKEQDRRYEAIFNNSFTFVGLLDTDGRILEANDTALAFGGHTRAELLGQPVWDTSWFRANPSAATAARDGVECARSGEPFRTELWVQGVAGEALIDFTIRPIVDEDGDVSYLVPEGRDVTELYEHERRYDTLVRNIPGIVYRCRNERGWPMEDVRGDVERLTGYTAHEFESQDVLLGEECIHPEDRETVWRQTALAIETRESFEHTYRIETRGGAVKWVWERGQPVFDGDSLEYLEGFITDITDRKEQRRQLTVLSRVLRHNLRNDLSVIQTRAELVRDSDCDAVRTHADAILSKSSELLAVGEKERKITQILTEEPEWISIELQPLLRQLMAEVSHDYPDAQVTMECPDDLRFTGTAWVEEAIEELVTNSIIHNDADSIEVCLSVAVENGECVISIRDNGPEIPTEEREALLDYREETPLLHGSGFGLWLVALVVSRSDATLEIESNEPRGNLVRLRFPMPAEQRSGDVG